MEAVTPLVSKVVRTIARSGTARCTIPGKISNQHNIELDGLLLRKIGSAVKGKQIVPVSKWDKDANIDLKSKLYLSTIVKTISSSDLLRCTISKPIIEHHMINSGKSIIKEITAKVLIATEWAHVLIGTELRKK